MVTYVVDENILLARTVLGKGGSCLTQTHRVL